MEDQELLNKIKKQAKGDWKREDFIKNCLRWTAENFDEIEPTIKMFWMMKETGRLGQFLDLIGSDYKTLMEEVKEDNKQLSIFDLDKEK